MNQNDFCLPEVQSGGDDTFGARLRRGIERSGAVGLGVQREDGAVGQADAVGDGEQVAAGSHFTSAELPGRRFSAHLGKSLAYLEIPLAESWSSMPNNA